jgi:hypothetical protein
MQAHFRHLCFNSFPMVWKNPQAIGFWPLQSLFEHSGVHWDSNSQHGEFIWECEGSFPHTLLYFRGLPGLVLAHTLVSPCFGRELKVRVAIMFFFRVKSTKRLWHDCSSSSSLGNRIWTRYKSISLNYLLNGRNSGCHTSLLCYKMGRAKRSGIFWCETRIVCTGKNLFPNHGIVWEAIEWPRRSLPWSWTLYRLGMISSLGRLAF